MKGHEGESRARRTVSKGRKLVVQLASRLILPSPS